MCEKEVYLVQTEDAFQHHARQGHCVAVRVLQPEPSDEGDREGTMVGMVVPETYGRGGKFN